MTLDLRDRQGALVTRLPVERYHGPVRRAERRLLEMAQGPVIDVGCGPGRHVEALGLMGLPALGIDTSPSAIQLARRRGVLVSQRSAFDPVPLEGQWGSALLFDGNIGIGGDPAVLLGRVYKMLRPGGRVLAEFEPPGTSSLSCEVRVEQDVALSTWFAWATVAIDDVERLAEQTNLTVTNSWRGGQRWFACLERTT